MMPALSPTMTEASIVKWTVKEGDIIQPGMIIAEIETDKAIMEFESTYEGEVYKILFPSGSGHIKVGEVIAILKEEDDTEDDLLPYIPNAVKQESNSMNHNNFDELNNNYIKNDLISNNSQENKDINRLNILIDSNQLLSDQKRIIASPLAKKIALQHNIDISKISGSGPNSRIIKDDVIRKINNKSDSTSDNIFIESCKIKEQDRLLEIENSKLNLDNANISIKNTNTLTNKSISQFIPEKNNFYEELPISGMRKTIASRLTESKRNIPHFYLTVSCNVDSLIKLREEVNISIGNMIKNNRINLENNRNNNQNIKISINDFIIKAIAKSSDLIPETKTIWVDDDKMMRFTDGIDIAVAVSIPNGLVTPIVRKANQKSILNISTEVKELAEKAKIGRLHLQDLTGGAITISNLGMYGIDQFSAIINPPHSSIISIGSIKKQPVVINDDIIICSIMNITISCDHRVIDGTIAAKFINYIKDMIENPIELLI
ncbi:Dihydrolipoyllysine-residue acetyltransferase E2 component of pyruvate dehydrogenase complex [Lyticum sinuosum]|uniref:Dihydrolipoamide acetyltransferase component of pyruvate dehydrogenase complex n=2 Tax=Lyticum sinuosum TaxID=1332059 RepID=A0AAE5AHH1_9RICK|nr:Dihydrolipoyllysine-residue acetyltransferase E2 component of pyruvate dehydrogenase complex [Lyticum sinuosum]